MSVYHSSEHANGQFLVCLSQQWHREYWHFTIVSVFCSGGGGGVGSDYMCTGHAVWPACRLVIPTLCHTCTKEDFMLIIGQVRQSELLPTISFFPIIVRSIQIIVQTPFYNETHICWVYMLKLESNKYQIWLPFTSIVILFSICMTQCIFVFDLDFGIILNCLIYWYCILLYKFSYVLFIIEI